MEAKVSVKVGSAVYQFSFDEKEEMDTLNKIITLGNPPRVCDSCDNSVPTDFTMDSNKDKEGNIYVNVACLNPDCKAKAKLGRYKTGGFFWHEFKKYIPQGETTSKIEVAKEKTREALKPKDEEDDDAISLADEID